jgi:polyhydroxyalkanoate synthase
VRKNARLFDYVLRSAGDAEANLAIEPLPQDHRFNDPAWKAPFNFFSQAFC